jgi:hypothetical protein
MMIRVAHWFGKQIIRDPTSHQQSSNSALIFQGASRTGKTTIAQALEKELNGYLWEKSKEYQHPGLAFKSLIHLSEVVYKDHLHSDSMCQILGFKEGFQINSKNKHPVEMTMNMPVIGTTNDCMRQYYKSYCHQPRTIPICKRLLLVKLDEIFEETYFIPHDMADEISGISTHLLKNVATNMKVPNPKAIINTIMAMAIILLDKKDRIHLPFELFTYTEYVFNRFSQTIFGKWLLDCTNDSEFWKLIEGQLIVDGQYEKMPYPEDMIAHHIKDW